MSSPASLIARLAAEGVSPELLGDVAMALASAHAATQAIEKRRAADRDRQSKRRENHVMSRDVTGQNVTSQTAPNGPAPCPPHTPPITPTPNTHSDPVGPGSPSVEPTAPVEIDPRKDLFARGVPALRRMTGRAEPGCRALLGKWLGLAQDSAVIVMTAVDAAVEGELASPIPWIERTIRNEVQRNGSGPNDLFNGRASGGRPSPTVNSAVATAVARHAARRGLGPGGGADDRRSRDPHDHSPGRHDPEIEDADWSPARGYHAAH